MSKFLTGSDAVVVSPPFVAADGYTPADTDGDPVLAITSATGQTVTAGSVSTVAGIDGVYQATVQALANPDLLTVTWTGAVDSIDQVLRDELDVVGGVYLSKAQLFQLPNLDKYEMPRLEELRDEFEDTAERWIGNAFVRRLAVETIPYRCGGMLLLGHLYPREFISVLDEDDVELDLTDWTTQPTGEVDAPNVTSDITVMYVHGLERPPVSLVTACKDFVRAKALQNNKIGKDVLRITDPSGVLTQFSTPDWAAGRPTGFFDIDKTLVSLGSPEHGIG